MSEVAERVNTMGVDLSALNSIQGLRTEQSKPVSSPNTATNSGNSGNSSSIQDTINLSPEAEEQLRKLRQRDAEVRRHENAHLSAAGAYAVGGTHYDTQQGPDGKQYAIGGHVNIDTSPVPGDPEQSEAKAEQVKRAALAPSEPSAADMQIAAKASQMAMQARIEQQTDSGEEDQQNNSNPNKISANIQEKASNAYNAVASFFADNSEGVGPAMSAFKSSIMANLNDATGISDLMRGIQAYNANAMDADTSFANTLAIRV